MADSEKTTNNAKITGGKTGEESPVLKSNTIEFPPALSVRQLSDLLNVSPVEIIKRLMRSGVMANINQINDVETEKALAPVETNSKVDNTKPKTAPIKTPVNDVKNIKGMVKIITIKNIADKLP